MPSQCYEENIPYNWKTSYASISFHVIKFKMWILNVFTSYWLFFVRCMARQVFAQCIDVWSIHIKGITFSVCWKTSWSDNLWTFVENSTNVYPLFNKDWSGLQGKRAYVLETLNRTRRQAQLLGPFRKAWKYTSDVLPWRPWQPPFS